MALYSVAFSAPGKTILEQVNNPANWPSSIPAGMGSGPVGALRDAVRHAIKVLNPDGSQFHSDANKDAGNSGLHATTLSVVASYNSSTHAVSVSVS